jgi:hypothetical protein
MKKGVASIILPRMWQALRSLTMVEHAYERMWRRKRGKAIRR